MSPFPLMWIAGCCAHLSGLFLHHSSSPLITHFGMLATECLINLYAVVRCQFFRFRLVACTKTRKITTDEPHGLKDGEECARCMNWICTIPMRAHTLGRATDTRAKRVPRTQPTQRPFEPTEECLSYLWWLAVSCLVHCRPQPRSAILTHNKELFFSFI